MATFYYSAGGPRWSGQLDYLNPNTSICEWDFVSELTTQEDGSVVYEPEVPCTDCTNGIQSYNSIFCNEYLQVTALVIHKRAVLQGINVLPTELAFFSQMKFLNLHDYSPDGFLIGGTLPAEFSRWSNLEYFSAPVAEITGTLPPEYGTAWKNLSK